MTGMAKSVGQGIGIHAVIAFSGVLAGGFMLGAGCGKTNSRADIQSADAGQRILAIKAAGDRRDLSAVPLLIDRLDDEDEGVRFYAILALERITGDRLGYDYRAGPERQARAVERWRRYVRDGALTKSLANEEQRQHESEAVPSQEGSRRPGDTPNRSVSDATMSHR
jgi:HEAT repeat protein